MSVVRPPTVWPADCSECHRAPSIWPTSRNDMNERNCKARAITDSPAYIARWRDGEPSHVATTRRIQWSSGRRPSTVTVDVNDAALIRTPTIGISVWLRSMSRQAFTDAIIRVLPSLSVALTSTAFVRNVFIISASDTRSAVCKTVVPNCGSLIVRSAPFAISGLTIFYLVSTPCHQEQEKYRGPKEVALNVTPEYCY
jgi:hypothetical protein